MTIVDRDPALEQYREAIGRRELYYGQIRHELEATGGLLGLVSAGHHYFGFNAGEGGVWYREWAPGAEQLWLTGEFNGWDRSSYPLSRDENGVWSIFLPEGTLQHGQTLKTHVLSGGVFQDRIPAYIRRVVQDPRTKDFVGQFWQPKESFQFQHPNPEGQTSPRIYEAHVGMAQEEGKVGTFTEFRENILPRIARLGYNTVQLMAIQEHPYYGSFGYHVSNFFAVSSRFGTPEDLKALIDEAHRLGLRVLLDIVHSHSVKNTAEGLAGFDGTPYQYFHEGVRGLHPAWDSMLFDYTKYEVRRFLLSNARYWLEEFRFDGFRFDGVTSMLYHNHGLGTTFSSYDDYFSANTDDDSAVYLKLANDVAHAVNPNAITIGEDVSGMPGLARPTSEWGLGFDYRLAMGIPDAWFNIIKERSDENWPLEGIFGTLLNRRHEEKHVAYVESHDQALVGDKTLAFWLMDAAMYTHMAFNSASATVDRGVALHKIVRLLTFSLGGEAYLNFMGNEFGHPEWIDFPREGNNQSYHWARRQWSLVDNELLRYAGLARFDQAMQELDERYNLLADPFIGLLTADEEKRLLVYRRGPLVFALNLHPTQSYVDLRIPVPDEVDYRMILNSDASEFSGHGRVQGEHFPWSGVPAYRKPESIQVYLPNRTMLVFAPNT